MKIEPDLLTLSRDGAIPHVCLATGQIVAEVAREGETIREFVDRTGWEDGPPIVVYEIDDDGKRIARLRAEWHRPIAAPRTVFVSAPLGGGGGGGGSQVLSIVAMIALMVVANVVGGAIAGALELGAAATAIATNIITAVIIAGGGLLISHFMRPKAKKPDAPVNDFALSGNMAKPGQPIPVQYGRLKFNPDFSDAPYTDYSGVDSVFHALFCLGVGEYDIEEFGIHDTPIWTAVGGLAEGFSGAVSQGKGSTAAAGVPDVAWQIAAPGETVTLFATNIAAAPDVSGQVLPDPWGTHYENGVTLIGPNGETSGPQWLGGFTVNPPDTIARRLAIDIAWPAGHYQSNESGHTYGSVTPLLFHARRIDSQGQPIGDWIVLYDHADNFFSRTPWRKTYHFDLDTPGRYEVRVARKTRANAISRVVNSASWIGCRAYCDGPSARPHVTQFALQAKADKLLSGFNAQHFYVVATRKIPVWNAGTSTWVTQASRNPVWAACDLWADTRYGAGRPRDDLDMPTMIALASGADARSETFDHRFTTHQSIIEALGVAFQSIRAQPLPLWNKLSAVRDEPRSLPRLHLTDFEIARGSFKATHRLADAIVSDAVVGQYFDETIWRMAEVSSIGTVAGLQNPTRVILQGVTKRDQAYGNVVYLDRVNRYRRSSYSLEVEGEGKLVKRGDLVRVATELPGSWGGSFRVETYNITLRRLTLHADADWSKSGQRYITIKMRTGAPFGPVKCARGLTDNQVAINGTDLALVEAQQGTTLADALYRTDVSELPSASLSVGAPQEFLGLVHEVDAGSVEGHIRLSLTPYAASQIYAALAPLPAVPTPPTLVLPLVPGNISGIGATLLQEGATLTLRAVWQPDRGSESYEAQYSADAGESWQACYAGASAQFEMAGFSGSDLLLRVRGVRGAQRSVSWSQVSVVAPAIVNTLDNLGLTVEVDAAIAGALVDGLAPINAAIDGMSGAANDAAAQVRAQVAEAADLAELQNVMDRLRGRADVSAARSIAAAARSEAAAVVARMDDLTPVVDTIRSGVADARAEITTERGIRAAADEAISASVVSVTSRVGDSEAAIQQEASTRSTADTALSNSVTTLTAAVNTNAQTGAFDAALAYNFDTTAEGWTVSGGSMTVAYGVLTITSTGDDPIARSPDGLSIAGATNRYVRIRMRRTAGFGWDGTLYYTTASHGLFSGAYRKTLSAPSAALNEWTVVEWDMHALTDGGTDWRDSTITRLRLDLGTSASDVFEVDWIAVGRYGAGGGQLAAAVQAGLTTEQTVRADADTALSNSLTALTTRVGTAESGLSTAITASVTRDQALVGAIDQLGVAYNGNLSELRDAMAAWQSNQAAQGASSLAAQAMAGSETIRTSVARLDDALYSMSTVILARADQATAAISDLATVQANDHAALANAASEIVVGYAGADQQGELAAALQRWRAAQDAQAASSAAALAIAGVRETQSGLATATDAIASLQTVVGARFGDVTADYQSLIQTQANALGALTASVVGISATSSAGTAGGRIQFVTSSSPGSGVQAAYDLQVSGTVGGAFNAAGLRVQYNTDGSTAIVMSADRFFVEAGATRQTVFVANSDGFTLAGVTRFGSTVRSTATNTDGSPKWQIKPTGELIASNAIISGVIKGASLDVGEALRFGAGAQLRNGQLPWPYAFFDYLHEFYVDPSLAVQRVGISPERIGLALNIAQLGIDSATAASLDANRQLMAPVGAGDGSLGAWLMPDGTFRKTGSLTTLPAYGDQSQGDVHPLIWDPDFTRQSGTPKTCICWARGDDEILTVPAGVSSLTLKLWGGGGSRPGNSTRTAGAGGAVQLTISVSPGDKLRIAVGLGGCFGDARTFGYWSGASAPHVDSPINGYARAGKGLFNATPLQTASGGGATMVSRINADGSETILGIAGGGGAASTSADGTPGGPYQSGVTGGAGGVNGASCTTNGQGAGGGGAEGGALTKGGTNYIISGATATQSVAGSASVPPLTSDTHYQAHLTRMNFLSGAPARRAPGYGAVTNRPPIGPLVAAGGDIMNGGSTPIGLYYGAQPGSAGLAVLIFN